MFGDKRLAGFARRQHGGVHGQLAEVRHAECGGHASRATTGGLREDLCLCLQVWSRLHAACGIARWAEVAGHTLQHGQTKPLMFSTTPMTGSCTFLQKLSSLRTSAMAISCGVVTMTAPSTLAPFKYCTTEMCSSEVPGGAVCPSINRVTGAASNIITHMHTHSSSSATYCQ